MTRLTRYLEIRHTADISDITRFIPELSGLPSALIQVMYADFCDDVLSTSWTPVMIDDYPLDQFKEWLDQELTYTQPFNIPRLEV